MKISNAVEKEYMFDEKELIKLLELSGKIELLELKGGKLHIFTKEEIDFLKEQIKEKNIILKHMGNLNKRGKNVLKVTEILLKKLSDL